MYCVKYWTWLCSYTGYSTGSVEKETKHSLSKFRTTISNHFSVVVMITLDYIDLQDDLKVLLDYQVYHTTGLQFHQKAGC